MTETAYDDTCLAAFRTTCGNCDDNSDCTQTTGGQRYSCDTNWHVCAVCDNNYTGVFSDLNFDTPSDTCTASGTYCRRSTSYNTTYHQNYPPRGTACENLTYTSYIDTNTGYKWIASTETMNWWSAASFCAKAGGKMPSRADVCGTTVGNYGTCSRTLFTALQSAFSEATSFWTRDNASTSNPYQIRRSDGRVTNVVRINLYHALCYFPPKDNADCTERCPDKPVYDSTSEQCVQCVTDSHCGSGYTCQGNVCVQGG